MENKELYSEYMKAFLAENSKVNLISKNDEKFLWEKHVCDSLAISEFFDKYKSVIIGMDGHDNLLIDDDLCSEDKNTIDEFIENYKEIDVLYV